MAFSSLLPTCPFYLPFRQLHPPLTLPKHFSTSFIYTSDFPPHSPCDSNPQKNSDADLEASQSELTFLRLQLRALEVQCSAYIPFGADEELSESIKNWKLEWADIDQRTKARRRKRKGGVDNVDELGTAVHGSK
jgi:hypothetical protein